MNGNLSDYGQGQGQQKQRDNWEKIVDLLHYNEKDKTYKSLRILKTKTGNIVLQARDGQTGGGSQQITFQLNEQEIALLSIKLQKLL